MDVHVGNTTTLNAGIINSQSGDLSLSTKTLTTQDFNGEKQDTSLNLSATIDVSGAAGSITNLTAKPKPGIAG